MLDVWLAPSMHIHHHIGLCTIQTWYCGGVVMTYQTFQISSLIARARLMQYNFVESILM